MRLLPRQQVINKVGFQKSTIYKLIAKGLFPQPVPLSPGSNKNAWLESEIDEWIAKHVAQSRNLQSAE